MQEYFFRTLLILIFGSIFSVVHSQEEESNLYQEFTVEIEGEYRFFFEEGADVGQKQNFPSLAIRPEYYLEWADGNQSLNFEFFARIDVDKERTHWDIREFYYQWVNENIELSVGMKKIFWGVTESIHLVDIINQTDQVESFDGEDKLGQPMVHFSWYTSLGTLDLFYLPYFRKRQFPGEKGRFRFPTVITSDDFGFSHPAGEWHQDFAIRYSNSIGPFDLGLSYFYGTHREPIFQPLPSGEINLYYAVDQQFGVDLQAITGAFLWKLEFISRLDEYLSYTAFAAGFEYTFSNIKSSGIDLGLLTEFLYDSRDDLALSSFQSDIFIGSRLAFNDIQSTEVLIGGSFDVNRTTKTFGIEAARRIGNSWKVELEARFFFDADESEFIYFFRKDSFLRVALFKYI